MGDDSAVRPRSMRASRVLLPAALVLAGALTAKAASGGDYPVRYAPLTPTDRARAAAQFRKRNGMEWHATIDEFGFVSSVSVLDPSWLSQDPRQNRIVTDQENRIVEDFIRKNAAFFGVDDPGSFRLMFLDSDPYAAPGQSTGVVERRCWAAQDISGRTFYLITTGSSERRTPINTWENPLQMTAARYDGPRRHAVLTIWGHFWPGAAVPATPGLTQDDILARASSARNTTASKQSPGRHAIHLRLALRLPLHQSSGRRSHGTTSPWRSSRIYAVRSSAVRWNCG